MRPCGRFRRAVLAARGRHARENRRIPRIGAVARALQPSCPNTEDQKGSRGAMHTTQLVYLSQGLAAYQSMEAISNNLANMSTAGFKREMPQFHEYVDQLKPGKHGAQSLSFVEPSGSWRDMRPGPIEMTHAPFDLAINGQGFFAIQTANGMRYTRNGHFTLDASGRITTAEGDPLQGSGGDISVSATDGDVHIAADGMVSGQNGQIGQVQLVDFPDDSALVKEGSGLYSTTQASQTPDNASLEQGAIEGSNVQPVAEITKMIEVMRSYQAVASMSETHSALMRTSMDKLTNATQS
jgi:flagellar basal-body rod protein FlgF